MAIKKMKIRIEQNGQTAIQVEGAIGNECLIFTQALEKTLGKVKQREMINDQNSPLTVTNREFLQDKL